MPSFPVHPVHGRHCLSALTALSSTPRMLDACAGTWLMVDGEDISFERIYVEVHPRLCSVIIA